MERSIVCSVMLTVLAVSPVSSQSSSDTDKKLDRILRQLEELRRDVDAIKKDLHDLRHPGKKIGGAETPAPRFALAWSEYPSWSVFSVAHELGLLDQRAGHLGAFEKKWGVDIELVLLEYDPSIMGYSAGKWDAVCMTNLDALVPATLRKSVAILPTSTSAGHDACLVTFDVADKKKALIELKKHKVFGLANSVSEYTFDRNLEKLGLEPKDYKFADEDPLPAAMAVVAKKADHRAIMVWNPFVLEVLDKNKDAKRLFDSSTIPEEIIDMVVVAEASLKKEKGRAFAHCVVDVFYEMNKLLQNREIADMVLAILGERFTTNGKTATIVDKLKTCIKQAPFYKTPDEGLKLFEGKKLPESMKLVTKFCFDKQMIKKETPYSFGPPKAGDETMLRFDPTYMQEVKAARK